MLYFLVTAMYPRFVITLNEELEAQAVTVRVGQVCIPAIHSQLPAVNPFPFRPLTSSAKPVSHVPSLGSRHIKRQCGWGRLTEQNWLRKSLFLSLVYSKGLLSFRRTRGGRRKIRWSFEF